MTLKQKQTLLAYLGYYDGPLDGLLGEKSKRATIDFQRYYMAQEDVDGIFGAETEKRILEVIATGEKPVATDTNVGVNIDTGEDLENWWGKYPNFTRSEFMCRCGGKYCGGYPAEPKEKLVGLLQKIRNHYEKPVNRESGLRCEKWNAIQGGVAASRHRLGQAMDFYISGVNPEDIVRWVKANCPDCGYVYAIRKSDGTLAGTVHVDVVM